MNVLSLSCWMVAAEAMNEQGGVGLSTGQVVVRFELIHGGCRALPVS